MFNKSSQPVTYHPEQSEGSKFLVFLGVLLSKHFRFLTPFGMTGTGRDWFLNTLLDRTIFEMRIDCETSAKCLKHQLASSYPSSLARR